ncbi:MAG: hypothetical protein M1833_000941 [Piccolia ochrophora]|nr:MAG: hypothetical protein M1833_000941 [Piccolia ochrophora]
MGGEDQGEERSREVEMRFKANEAEILRKINDRQNQSSFLGRLNQDPRYSPLFQEEDFAAAVRMEANKHTPRVPFENLYASAAASAGQPPRDMRTLAVGSKTPASAVTNVTTANGEMHFPRLGATVDASTNARFAQGLTGTSGLAPVSSDIQAGSMRPRADSRAEEVNKLFANLRREEHKEVTAYRKTNRR